MGKTLAEKVLSQKTGEDLSAGDLIICESDFTFIHDFSGPLTLEQLDAFELENGIPDSGDVAVFFDHASPSSDQATATDHSRLRSWVKDIGGQLFDVGGGISHMQIAEEIAAPAKIILGADSHTCQAGAFGAFATGMGSTDIAAAIATGKTWLKVPETLRVEVDGTLPAGVFAKDIILSLIGDISMSGATYRSLEWGGSTVEALSMSERQTLANMAIEAGAKNAIMKTDEKVHSYLAEHGREDEFQPLAPDRDADYEEIIHIDASSLEPVVSVPHGVDNVEPISGVESESIAVDQVYLGSCTNGRIDDFEIAADILSRNDVAPDVRIVATPGSREIYKKGIRRGIWETLVDAGALVNSPGCGACPGVHTGILGDDEICLASINRNYKGRMGNPEASVFLASPATCAYSAVNGYISSPEGFFQ